MEDAKQAVQATKSLAHQIATSLQQEIVQGTLSVEARLPSEAEIAQRFGVSQPTVREALKILAAKKLVRSKRGPNGGVFVNAPSLTAASQMLQEMTTWFVGLGVFGLSEIVEARLLLGRTCVQAEDEMSALAHCLGASYAGAKSMTATSGPGLSLMQELLGLGSTAELPVVIVNCMRGGPSTGLPTKPEQSDLNEMVYGSHGEASRIVLAPTGVRDCFHHTIWAFNLAERYQVPVLLATDHSLTVRTENVPLSSLKGTPVWERRLATAAELTDYKRYKFMPDGISPMAIPGMKGGMHVAEGLEHNEYGNPNYTGANHEAMLEKRLGKIEDAWKFPGAIERFGDEHPDLLVVTWGSTKGPAKEAVLRAIQEGKKVGYLIPKILHPLPKEGFLDVIEKAPKVLVAEMNHTGQLEGLLRRHVARHYERLNRVHGSPMTWLEIYEKVDACLARKPASVKAAKPVKEAVH